MEPLFFKAENGSAASALDRIERASMEPLFFKAENALPALGSALRTARFNGAAFFKSGKLMPKLKATALKNASMEPLFFKAENAALKRRRHRWH